MCGIFTLIGFNDYSIEDVENEFNKGKKRGPDHSILERINNNIIIGFHRLAINGLTEKSNQPLKYNNIILICNGEIYNYKELYNQMNINLDKFSDSDCEVIIHLYLKYGIEHTLHILDGVFAFILFDMNQNLIYIARDPYGIRPLYFIQQIEQNLQTGQIEQNLGFASELKMLSEIIKPKNTKNTQNIQNTQNTQNIYRTINHFSPGYYWKLYITPNGHIYQYDPMIKYHMMPFARYNLQQSIESTTHFLPIQLQQSISLQSILIPIQSPIPIQSTLQSPIPIHK